LAEVAAVTTPGPLSDQWTVAGFNALSQVYDPDVADILGRLISDPQPLVRVLDRYPRTLVHGDFKAANLAWKVSPQLQVVAFDWQMAAVGIPTMDLGWYLAAMPHSLPAPPALSIELYHGYLAKELGTLLDESRWQPLLELGMLTAVMRTCIFSAYFVMNNSDQARRDNLRKFAPMWSDWVRAGVKWL
jgi:hypothetical protein